MFTTPEDIVRGHQADLLDEACRARRGARLARTEGLRHRAQEAIARHRLASARTD
jgi:hypothetical protein